MVRSRVSPRAVRSLAAAGIAAGLLLAQGCTHFPLARPSMRPFDRLLQQPADSAAELTVRFLGTSSLLFTARNSTSILMDGFVSRPGPVRVGVLGIRPDCERIVSAWERLGRPGLAAVFAGHAHYDHAMDSPVWAQLGRAKLVGSRSVQMLGFGIGLPAEQTHVVREGVPVEYGDFELTFIESVHGRPDRFPGTIYEPFRPKAKTARWETGLVYSVFVRHRGWTILVQSTAGYKPGALRGRRADVVYLAIGGLGRQSIPAIDAYWSEVVRATGARRVILVHWDDFFRPLGNDSLKATRYIGDNVARSIERMVELAAADSVSLRIPPPWTPTNPLDSLITPIAPDTAPRPRAPLRKYPVPNTPHCETAR